MRNIIIFTLILVSIRCGNDLLNVKAVTVPELYNNIKENNVSSLVLLNIWSTMRAVYRGVSIYCETKRTI